MKTVIFTLSFIISIALSNHAGAQSCSCGNTTIIVVYSNSAPQVDYSYQQPAYNTYQGNELYGNTAYYGNQPSYYQPQVDPNTVRSWLGVINDGVNVIGNGYNVFGGISNGVRNGFTPVQTTSW